MKWLHEIASVLLYFLSGTAIWAGKMDAATAFALLAIWNQMRKDEVRNDIR